MTGQWVAFFDVLGHSKNKNVKLLRDPWIKYHYDLAVKIFIIKDYWRTKFEFNSRKCQSKFYRHIPETIFVTELLKL